MMDATLIVQGKLLTDTYKFYCLKCPAKKVFCTWRGNEKGWKDPGLVMHSANDVFMRRRKHERFSSYDYSLELQVLSVMDALEHVDTEYVVKLRGDEWYSNLEVVLEAVKSDPGRIYSIPAFFRRWEVSPFHASDHLFAGRTENIRLMFRRCLMNMSMKENDSFLGKPLSPSGMLCRGYVEAKSGGGIDKKKEFKRLFGLVPMDQLRFYKVASEESGRCWYSNFDPRNDGSWEGSISSMEEL